MARLFSYGTLQQEAVQLQTFGRKLAGQADELVGFEHFLLKVEDRVFVAKSGKALHAAVRPNGRAQSRVAGVVFEVSEAELAQADGYEPAPYTRVAARLASGGEAWVYAAPEAGPKGLSVEGMAPLLQVFDMPTSIAFYRDVLGFEIVSSSPPRGPDDVDWCWLRLADTDVMLNTAYEEDSRPPKPDPARIAAHDDTGLFFGCRDVDAAYEYLRGKGVKCEPPKDAPYGMRQLYFKDPDGYNICLQWSVK